MASDAASFVKFFTQAGIEESQQIAAYTHIFVSHRIKFNMLQELTKEYLREMGFTALGDIISILRHAKRVSDQNARDKIMTHEPKPVPVAKVAAASSSVVRVQPTSTVVLPKPRRVLPEHEGKYKITLPTGTTARSQEILAKKAQMQSSEVKKTASIFDRLRSTERSEEKWQPDSSSSTEPIIRVVGLNKPPTSIFTRLGGKSLAENEIIEKSIGFAGILKNSPTKSLQKGISKSRLNQRVMLVKKLPTQLMDSDESDSDGSRNESDNSYKQVKFSPEVEVLEIAPNRKLAKSPNKPNTIKGARQDGIKSRLGFSNNRSPNRDKFIHATKRTTNMKTDAKKLKSAMASDLITKKISVHNRISLKNKAATSQLATRIQRFKIDSVKPTGKNKRDNVFSRLH